jgi:hypothetical protein
MTGPCKGWNGETVPLFTPPLGDAGGAGVSHITHRHDGLGLEVNNYKHLYVYKYELFWFNQSGFEDGDVDSPSHHPELFAVVALQNELAIEVKVIAKFCERCAVHHHTFKCVREHLRIDSLHRVPRRVSMARVSARDCGDAG